MRDGIAFFHIKDPSVHPLTRIGYTSINSDGRLIVYCTDEGPLDGQYRTLWLEWKKKSAAEKKEKDDQDAKAAAEKRQRQREKEEDDAERDPDR